MFWPFTSKTTHEDNLMVSIKDMDVFFITFDEPLRDRSWKKAKARIPNLKRIDGIKGFDKAHKECLRHTTQSRIVIIDGDNCIESDFLEAAITKELYDSNYVLSWAASNSINSLAYGNGGVKSWPTQTLQEINSHENAVSEKESVDFCFTVPYYLMGKVLTTSRINHTPYQSFRSGYREAIKMSLVEGVNIFTTSKNPLRSFKDLVPKSNLKRLKIWCTIGRDVNNGEWAIYGARKALVDMFRERKDYTQIRDYDWFEKFWSEEVRGKAKNGDQFCETSNFSWSRESLENQSGELLEWINHNMSLHLCEYSSKQSEFFKENYTNMMKKGLMKC